jgi:predicted acylesterase/phospholipase RssA
MTRRILSIDGGGIRGVFPAGFLAALEENLPQPIGSYFDLISGTSTGGIIAIGLAMGLSAKDILALYEERGPEIFEQEEAGRKGFFRKVRRNVRGNLFGPKYLPDKLREALEDTLGDRRIGDAKTRLMIPAWHPQTRKVYIYKTAHHPRFETDYRDAAIDAAMATAAAPTYFPQHVTEHDVGLVDGGIWANNPVGYAVAEAIGTLGWQRDELKVLSISCLEDIFSTEGQYSKASIALQATKFFMAGQSYGSLGLAHILTGDPHENTSIYRVCQPVPDGFFSLDNTARIRELKDRAFVEAREKKPILKPVFFAEQAEPFSPHHELKD